MEKVKSKMGKLGKIGEPFELAEDAFLTRVINAIIEKQGEIIDQLNQSQNQPEEDYTNTEPEKVIIPDFTGRTKPNIRWKTREEIEKMFEPEETFTKEELKVIKMSLDGLGANDICTLLDEESFDNTKAKVLSKLKDNK
jgi:hypothetical protein